MRRVFVVGVLSALVVALVPSAGAQTRTVTSVIGSADGLFVEVELAIDSAEVGALQDIAFGPEPTVTLPPTGGSVSEQVLNVDESAGPVGLTAAVLTAAAEGALGPDGFATAESTVADIALVDDLVPLLDVGAQQDGVPILTAELISATCSADLSGVSGSTTLAGATVLGTALDVEPAPNTELEISIQNGISATVGVTLNRQVENPDGSLSVTALVLDIDIDIGADDFITGTLQVGPATCGVVEGEVPPPAPAPAPAPVTAQVRFTG